MIKYLAILAVAAVAAAGAAAQAGNFDYQAPRVDVTQFRFPCAEPGCGVIVLTRHPRCVLPYCQPFPIPKPQPCPPWAMCPLPPVDLQKIQ